jgi:RNA polymerase sigma-70 factor (ECF subfamily)
MSNTFDRILIQKIKLGNKNAFDSLFIKYYKPLYRYALNYCNNSIIAEESIQKTFIKIWQNNTNFFSDDNVGKILFVCIKNSIIDEIRKEDTRKKYESSEIDNSIYHNTELNDSKNQTKAILESAIDKLPKKAKEIFRLAKQEGLSIKEIAEYLKISNKTVENQLTIAYKKLRLHLEPYKNQLNN